MERNTSLGAVVRMLMAIAIPISLQNLINVGVSVMDTLMIGSISETQLSGIAQANQPYFIFTTIVFGLASGSVVLTAQYWGKREIEPIRAIMGLMIRIGLICALVLSIVVLCFPERVMSLFSGDEIVIAYGTQYLQVIGFSYLFSAFTGVYLLGLRSVGNVRITMYVYGASFLINVFLNWVLIFGNLGAPRLEIRGAAIATLISRICEFLLALAYLYLAEKKVQLRLGDLFRPTRIYWKNLFKYSGPVLLSETHWGIGISLQAAIIGHLGVTALAASSFINVVQQLTGVAIMGIAAGSGVIIGNLIGEGKAEQALILARKLLKISVIIGVIVAALLIAFRPFAHLFINAEAATYELIRQMLFISAYLVFFQTVNMVIFMGILRGSGDTFFCASLDVGTFWIIKLTLGVLSAFVWHLPPFWVYFILSSDEMLKCLISLPRVLKNNWIHDTTVAG